MHIDPPFPDVWRKHNASSEQRHATVNPPHRRFTSPAQSGHVAPPQPEDME